ncbi:MAG: OmpA family protein [Thermaurantiacus sp.]|uniref:OmpA/MotB family protein n=1 Tax=Thermaurantiacus sp. TaxID=2820283 RepID=UPI00298F141B|nr:OmpA family protein [Thermaurantiacus sp.]MDW8415894.1 OmpA family protein [Thermaurantiacus sp.]
MRARLPRQRTAAEEDEGYFVSMSDMLTGLLFVFIILLLFFAFQFRRTTEELTGASEARAALLRALQEDLRQRKVEVEIDVVNGILRLDSVAMFEVNEHRLTTEGLHAVRSLADALARRLPCYSDTPKVGRYRCRSLARHRVETVLIEGHTDAQPRGVGLDTNIELSAMRAITTYRTLIARQPALNAIKTRNPAGTPQRILSVSGYGPTRPLSGFEAPTPRNFQRNRRIDVRLLMATPQAGGSLVDLAR